MFDTLLIANRGEIACRIMRTARAMGIRTVAVYSDADRDALHVQLADTSVHIGGAAARDSYLRVDRIIAAAQTSSAQALHPGYGFLSERPDLAEACVQAGLIWVGPHPHAIRIMGAKIEAKAVALAAGVPCLPGYAGADQRDETLIAAAHDIGLPVMIKASAGGGGKGMRVVHDPGGLADAIQSARAESERAFGEGRLMIEKLVQNPRHIEVQLLGDKHGNLLHLHERDCSVQRNHQKLLEEAPAPNLSATTRDAMFDAALRLGREIGYDSAGTVEFVMEGETEAYHFLEMNTRLQVEHTVTEEVTGLDLVEQQLRVAAGQPLGLTQADIRCCGHAIEARLTAEDAALGFRPQTGEILHWAPDPGLRCDSGVQTGSVVASHYDSMIAKLIAHGTDRDSARKSLIRGLERTGVAGLGTNRLFLRDALARDAFAQGCATTGFIAAQWPDGWAAPAAQTTRLAALARHSAQPSGTSPWYGLGGMRLLDQAGQPACAQYLETDAPDAAVEIRGRQGQFEVTSREGTVSCLITRASATEMNVIENGFSSRYGVFDTGTEIWLWSPAFDTCHRLSLAGDLRLATRSTTDTAPDRIVAPIPGLVADLPVAVGKVVQKGETVVVLESMKLLMELKAMADGVVSAIACEPGATVDAGEILIRIDITKGA